ncbi:RagB/SusD family nutrient uptake outer membrane protein [Terrimonas sp. NA20]|uniref:RagB/SusD family nutrient uptake outer membrane protein n=1 Tax=Terrimonas ginsenosidimutans TaxID=2908004 RepID=A0ABS9KU72_9BACT|nr:RagB/SusD family nutrient uptake outer membrane protein [Terrimonas ginsenosidimutans]MCG2615835.1 RagB/SusD family nutrient uptake outer membrane protein [Terrimonas ginsenosidimutans]
MRQFLYTLSIVTFLGATSCQKKVTDNVIPNDRVSSDLAFSTTQKIESAVAGGYNSLQDLNFLSGRALVYIDLQGEDIFDRGNFFGDLPRFNMLSNNGIPAGVWNAGYSAIATANRNIAGIEANASLLTSARIKVLIAESKFIRAVSLFYLVNFFAQPFVFTPEASHAGIPLILQSFSSNDPAGNKPRSTVAEVYTQIIKDLQEALTDLPVQQDDLYSTKTRATKASATALLARTYLYKNDYANAKTLSKQIIDGLYGTFALQPTPNGAFGTGNFQTSETIWSIPNSVNDNPNTNNSLPQHYNRSGRADLAVSKSFTNTVTNPYFATDDRRRTTMLIESAALPGYFFTTKYTDPQTRADWAPIIRYAEILLTYAEATARLATGVDADAIAATNLVRDRSRVSAPAYTVASFTTKDELINAIAGERRIELAFEGHRLWDILRVKGNVTNKYDNNGVTLLPVQIFGSDKSIMPIPQAEIDKSKGVLTQNKGY